MAQPFLHRLKLLVNRQLPGQPQLQCKHFFGGAALYAHGVICVSLTPVGLAFKLPAKVCADLINCGAATQLKYFANSPIKKDYVLFSNPDNVSDSDLKQYFSAAVAQVRPTNT